MTIDEAIQFCTETAADYMETAMQYDECDEWEWLHKCANEEYAANYRQLAEWLRELQEAKRLLRLAVEDFKELCVDIFDHKYCKWYSKETGCIRPDDALCEQVSGWKHADEAEKLIGGNENV